MARIVILLAAMLLGGCGTVAATFTDPQGREVMLLGHDPVSYFTAGRARRGDPNLAATHEGRTYYFATEGHRSAFLSQPGKYEPQYHGFCANGMAYGVKMSTDPTAWTIVDGRLFIFGDILGHEQWKLDLRANIETGDALWAAEAKDAGWRGQTLKRVIFRVPHYRTSPELRVRWQAQNPGKTLTYDPGGSLKNLFLKYPGWRAREGYSQPALGFPGLDPCPPACPGEYTPGAPAP